MSAIATMTAADARDAAHAWVESNRERWPGLRAAHLVGGITSMPEDTPFPAHKDVDLHLVVAEGFQPDHDGPWSHIMADVHRGVAIEAGVKSVADYRSAETVLANPEIAHHLLGDAVLHDPDGLLRDLLPTVRREYPRRRWVNARLDHERQGLAGAFDMIRAARDGWGAAAEVNLFGYTMTYATAALAVAGLQPPRIGSHTLVRLREHLKAHGRPDLHEGLLAALGLAHVPPARVDALIDEAAEAFDIAVTLPRKPRPFEHKLYAHLRPYLIDSCRSMLADGDHREALAWTVAVHLATTEVVLTDGPEAARPVFAARHGELLRTLGLDTITARDAAIERLAALHAQVFALADDIVAGHPGIVD